MALLGEHLPHHHALERLSRGVNRLDSGAGHVEAVGEFFGGERNLNEFFQPLERDEHLASFLVVRKSAGEVDQNCLRNRMSPSSSILRSGML